jgi:transcriptional regulator with XRE-family HTH domain
MARRPAGPVLARKRLATALRELREQREYSLDQVARELMFSVSKLSRLEKAQGVPQLRDVRDLINFYDLAGKPQGNRLMNWARDGRRRGWWADFGDVLNAEDHEFIGYENEASVSLQYSIPIMPGLLQAESYARALTGKLRPGASGEEIDRVVETRLIRQRNLLGREGDAPPLELRVVLHEVCLLQSVGSQEALNDQFEALITASKAENIDIRVLPFSADAHGATTSMWQHFSFGEDVDRDVVFLETSAGFLYVEDESATWRFHRWFDELTRRSLDPAKSIQKISALLA